MPSQNTSTIKRLHIAFFVLVAGLLAMAACGERGYKAPEESVTTPAVEQQPAPVAVPPEPAAPETAAPVATTKEKNKTTKHDAISGPRRRRQPAWMGPRL